MSRRSLELLLDVTRAIPPGAKCADGSGAEFIDVGIDEGLLLARRYCLAGCRVVAECRSVGDRLAPHDFVSVFGGRVYDRREPVEGWEVA